MYSENNLIRSKLKGFTLIELLAVIVILAIIALISVPIVLNLINDAKNESDKRSIDLYGKAIELAIARKSLIEKVPTGNYKTNGNTLTLEDNEFSFEVEYEGSKVECNLIQLNDDMSIALDDCKVNDKKIDYSYGQIYTKLEYLESTGTQYIDTNFLVNIDNYSKVRFVVDTEIIYTKRWCLDGSSNAQLNAIYMGVGYNKIYYGIGNDTSTGVEYNQNRYVFDLDVKNNKYIVTNKTTGEYAVNLDTLNINPSRFNETGLYLWLFGYSGENSKHNAKIYNSKIYKDNILVRDFIPVLDKDGVPCMYDKVEGKFYYNNGTGDFKYE